MDSFSEIIKKRAAPGILIFDLDNRLLFTNKSASDLIPELKAALSDNVPDILAEIHMLCNQVRSSARSEGAQQADTGNSLVIHRTGSLLFYSLRAFLIGDNEEAGEPTHVMVLVEGVIEKHQIDFEKARKDFSLSGREVEVLKLICQGLGNREIAKKLFISEHTVKDHTKKIMAKVGASSRSELTSLLR